MDFRSRLESVLRIPACCGRSIFVLDCEALIQNAGRSEPEMNLPTINQDTIREIMMSSEATNVIELFVNEQREMALILARLTNPAEQLCGAAFLWEALKREVRKCQ